MSRTDIRSRPHSVRGQGATRTKPQSKPHEFFVGGILLLSGLLMTGASLVALRAPHAQLAQATVDDSKGKTETQKDDVRPTTPAPEPARPTDNTTGSSPSSPAAPTQKDALPPAPPEKIGEPIQKK